MKNIKKELRKTVKPIKDVYDKGSRPIGNIKNLALVITVIMVIGLGLNAMRATPPAAKNDITQGGINTPDNKDPLDRPATTTGDARITFLDVGQGDGQLIEVDNKVILIDAGTPGNADRIIALMKDKGITKVDFIIATHPHNDHIGALPPIIEEFDVGTVVMPEVAKKDVPTTMIYKKLLTVLSENPQITVLGAQRDQILYNENGTKLEILNGPEIGIATSDLNNYSVVAKLTHGNNGFMFTGDAHQDLEKDIINNHLSGTLKSEVMALGHHGSRTSTSDEFLDSVDPDIAVISLGEGNKYKHPHSETIKKLDKRDIKYYQTVDEGDIIFVSDGTYITKRPN